MKTKKVAKATKTRKPQVLVPEAIQVPTKVVEIKVAKDPEQTQGLRGLRGTVFAEFGKFKNDLANLPGMDAMTKIVAAQYPQSRWIARPKVHYSYYKSKFLQSVKVA